MIVLNVTYKCKPEMREKFLGTIVEEGIDLASRAENGNYKYNYYVPTDGSNDLLLLEKWENDDVLDVHRTQPHFARLGELKNMYVEETLIEKFYTD